MNGVLSFEIPVADLPRAVAFYSAVFDVELERRDVDGNQMAWFPAGESWQGASGALALGDSYVPSHHGSRIYFSTASIEQTLSHVQAAGGKVLYPKTAIGPDGWVAEFEDSEGNCIALHEPAR